MTFKLEDAQDSTEAEMEEIRRDIMTVVSKLDRLIAARRRATLRLVVKS